MSCGDAYLPGIVLTPADLSLDRARREKESRRQCCRSLHPSAEEQLKAKIDKRSRQIDAEAAAADADRAEVNVADALDFAEWTVENAQLAMLDAIDVRASADQLAKAAAS